jgi:hypothetical protein
MIITVRTLVCPNGYANSFIKRVTEPTFEKILQSIAANPNLALFLTSRFLPNTPYVDSHGFPIDGWSRDIGSDR